MRFLAIDVGMGTQDILLYDSNTNVENCVKMVLPSQTQIVAQKIVRATKNRQDIVLVGETMGGGACTKAVKQHIAAKLQVFATQRAALTLNDDLNKVKEMGVVLVNEDEVEELNALKIEMKDVDKIALEKALEIFGLELPERFAVAVQDHGYSPHTSNRVFRFDYFRELIKKNATLDQFVYHGNIPERFTRMKAVERTLPNVMLMDTGMAAIRGALLDEHATSLNLVVNIGNGHTLACVVQDNYIISLFEHHTYKMTANKIEDYLRRLCDGTLSFQEIYQEGGHGCYIKEDIRFNDVTILITGPHRNIMRSSKLDISFAAPFGDMMLTGCFGLMDAYNKLFPNY